MKAIIAVLAAMSVGGCAGMTSSDSVKPVTVQVTRSDFCETMEAVTGPTKKLTWSRLDTPESIHGIRRLAAAVDRNCKKSTKPAS